LNFSNSTRIPRLGREKRMGGEKGSIIVKLPLRWQNTPPLKMRCHLPHRVSRWSTFFGHQTCPHAPLEWRRGWWRAYTCMARVGLLYWFINIIIKKIIEKALRAYEYYKKKMMQIQKYPPKTTFNFSRSEGKHDILLYIKCAKTTPPFKCQYFLGLKGANVI